MSDNPAPTPQSQLFPSRPYNPPSNPSAPFPYTAQDLTPTDPSSDGTFYSTPRLVTHIDDNAITNLRRYYSEALPLSHHHHQGAQARTRTIRILDFCSSWISHYPDELIAQAKESGDGDSDIEVLGTGMNGEELKSNPVLSRWWVQDLNMMPEVEIPKFDLTAAGAEGEGRMEGKTEKQEQEQELKLDTATCTVSIDYLTRPVEVLSSIRRQMREGGTVHLAVSNRCFPTKVVGRWLRIGESERLNMVGDYLWWSGWRDIEIVTVVEGSWLKDPLWVVRARNSLR